MYKSSANWNFRWRVNHVKCIISWLLKKSVFLFQLGGGYSPPTIECTPRLDVRLLKIKPHQPIQNLNMGHNTTEDLWPETTFWGVTHYSLVERVHQHIGRHKCLSRWTNRLISTLKTEAAGNPPTCWWICTTL